jgi:hypothetical protein
LASQRVSFGVKKTFAQFGILLVLLMVLGIVRPVVWHADTLDDPHRVITWGARSLRLENGAAVPLPGVTKLTGPTNLLDKLVQEGVEIGPDGRPRVLVHCFLGCGTNAPRYLRHAVKVDLIVLLHELDLAETTFGDPWDVDRSAREWLERSPRLGLSRGAALAIEDRAVALGASRPVHARKLLVGFWLA